MIDPHRFHKRTEALSDLLQARLGVRGRGLERRLARAGRMLPRAVRREGQKIMQAGRLIGHPKLARLIDPVRTDRSFDIVTAHLKRFDRAEVRRNAVLSVLAVVVFNLMLLGLGVVALLRWQSLI